MTFPTEWKNKSLFSNHQPVHRSQLWKGSPFWTPRCIPDLQLRQSISQQNAVLKSQRHVAPGLHMALNMWPPNLGLFEWGKWWSSNGFWDTQPVSVSFSIPKSSISFCHIGFPGSIPTSLGSKSAKIHVIYGKSQVMDCKSWQPMVFWPVVSQYPNLFGINISKNPLEQNTKQQKKKYPLKKPKKNPKQYLKTPFKKSHLSSPNWTLRQVARAEVPPGPKAFCLRCNSRCNLGMTSSWTMIGSSGGYMLYMLYSYIYIYI